MDNQKPTELLMAPVEISTLNMYGINDFVMLILFFKLFRKTRGLLLNIILIDHMVKSMDLDTGLSLA